MGRRCFALLLLCCLATATAVGEISSHDHDDNSLFHSSPSPSATPTLCIDPCKIDLGQICALIYEPVCGCNGVTYSNECFAEREGVVRWVEGECQSSPSPTCAPTLFSPTSRVTPQPTNYFPPCIDLKRISPNFHCSMKEHVVCGCDGKTYRNACEALKQGVLQWDRGNCFKSHHKDT